MLIVNDGEYSLTDKGYLSRNLQDIHLGRIDFVIF
jgi:hypothetical protein